MEEETEDDQPREGTSAETNKTAPPVEVDLTAESDFEEEPDQDEDWTYASIEESTTESECNDDAEEQYPTDIR